MRAFLPAMVALLVLVAGCFAPGTSVAPATGGTPAVSVGTLHISGAWARVAGAPAAGMTMPTDAPLATATMGQHDGGAMAGAGYGNGAAYMTIRNTGSAPDRLVGAASAVAKAVEIHNTVQEGDVMKMRPVDGIEIPANGEASLAPGGYHVMMIGLAEDLRPGATISLTLRFATAGEITLPVTVRQP